ncbi:S-adenosyl-L-methionine-dependent methyltransferases superfamily protein [Rhynchospora pubera]|uniref:Methyltransferase n=1 Tax=Rhynchospora pubera TaxID=906938 RepID=A0AAV8G420_9POAL|nr:S-adenosyl-L-methionine-dependent methyltransferases superfamily protein [Rhynchospora pubera]
MSILLSHLPKPNIRTLSLLLATFSLSLISYLLGIYTSSPFSLPLTPSSSSSPPLHCHLSSLPASPPLQFLPQHTLPLPTSSLSPPLPPLPFCPSNFTHHCPCQNPSRERLYPTRDLEHRERHCPVAPADKYKCRIPRPHGYKTPPRWPMSRDRAWFKNVPSKRLSEAKKDQNWVRVEGDWLVFPGGGTSFATGVKRYVDQMSKIIPLRNGEIRTALDIGCGVASFGGHLLDRKILTVSIAPRDIHEAQVQFALERGIPAMLGVLSIHRLPFPSRSFDMVHCARCLVPWTAHDGLYLLEIDRVLRPGGYWVLSGPPISWRSLYKGWGRTKQDLEEEQMAIEDLARRLCWRKVAEKGTIAVWRKPTNHIHCAKKAKMVKSHSFCVGSDPDDAWYENMELCITPLPKARIIDDVAGGPTEKWPKRLNAIPPRIESGTINGITAETYKNDGLIWGKRVSNYVSHYIKGMSEGQYRNVLDMNAGLGGFAAALAKYPVWVMNVVPSEGVNNTLGVIYERGLIGTFMNWCEAFSTYPRTYDFIHAYGVFSLYMNKCDVLDILIEIDRILRPEGALIIRDNVDVITRVKEVSQRLSWKGRIVNTEKGPFDPEKLLIIDNSIY